MKKCDNCNNIYKDEIENCPNCNVPLKTVDDILKEFGFSFSFGTEKELLDKKAKVCLFFLKNTP